MQPPPPFVTTLTTLCCIGLVVWTFISKGRSTAALPVTAFMVLSLQLLTTKKPRFAQLTSSVFGLFYCGERLRGVCYDACSSCCGHPKHNLPCPATSHMRCGTLQHHQAYRTTRAGYLPSYWIKLRMLAAPAVNSAIAQHYPVSRTVRM